MKEVKYGYFNNIIMAIFTVVSGEFIELILPLTLSNDIVRMSNDNITMAQFEYNTNEA